jgi:two-component system cell cycle response regulator DivK
MPEQKNTILIIDDDARNIFALNLVLKSKGYTCKSAAHASEGLQLLTDYPEIKLVLLDMMMPETDGYQLLELIRNNEQLRQIPVIAVTAQAMQGDREKCLAAGANEYISKPVNIDALVNIIDKLL